MALRFFNTLSRKKEKFKPLKPGVITLYTCGPTVHDYAHLGNFRAFLFYDLLKRVLIQQGYKVNHVMNITDVDDKIIRKSLAAKKSLREFTTVFENAFYEDLETLNVLKANVYPRATENINSMVELIKKLLEKNLAYKSDDGCVYYAIRKFKDYGKLSKINLEKLEAGASGRVLADEYDKANVQDFALWKSWTKEDGDVFWETEIGKGRPGWHVECSAMSIKYLGETIDIHTGAEDLIFPHHENEIAQSEGATGKKFVNYWLHNAWLLVDGKKMSKSLGNFYTLRDIIDKGYDPLAIRFYLLSTHYRQKFNFTFDALESSTSALQRLWDCYDNLSFARGKQNPNVGARIDQFKKDFNTALENDLEISQALAALFDFVRDCNAWLAGNALSREDGKKLRDALEHADKVLGVLKKEKPELTPEEKALIEEREKARKAKNWERADQIRAELEKKGVIVEDTPAGPKWKKA